MSAPKWAIPDGARAIEVNGYPIAFQDHGSGAPLLLVHGSLLDYRFWSSQLEAFAGQHRVINPSLRHFYPEPWDGSDRDFSIAQHADDLSVFIRRLELGKVHLLAHSRGGAVAIELAKRNPQLLRTLTLADSSLRLEIPETPETLKALAFRAALFENLRKDMTNGDAEGAAAQFIDTLLGPGAWARLPPPVQQAMLQNLRTALVDDPLPLTTDEELRKFDLPVLTLTGETSPPLYRLLFDEMRKRAGFPSPIVIAGAGHAMSLDNPRAFNEAVLRFTRMH